MDQLRSIEDDDDDEYERPNEDDSIAVEAESDEAYAEETQELQEVDGASEGDEDKAVTSPEQSP